MLASIARHFLDIMREQSLDEDALKRLQSQRLEKLLASARSTPFYGRRLAANPAARLEDLPLTGKDAVRESPEAFLPSGTEAASLTRLRTSGTMGIPTSIFASRDSLARRSALLSFSSHMQGRGPLDTVAFIQSRRFPHGAIQESFMGLYRTIRLHSAWDEKENLLAMRRHGVNILHTYPNVAISMAAVNGGMRLKAVRCGGETIHPESRAAISDSFGCPVYSDYNCWEAATVAWECPEHSLHVHSGSALVEIVDRKGRPMKGGEGEIVVTPLHNPAMPLLRYRVGDRGEWGRECPCGRQTPVLKSLIGRDDDAIVLPSGRRRPGYTINVSMTAAVLAGTSSHQLVQEKPELFVFRYVPRGPGLDDSAKREIAERVKAACLGEDVRIEFEEASEIRRPPSGKLQRIISKVGR